MTTYLQLDRYAEDIFIPAMKERGFQHHKGFVFSHRKDNGIYDLIGSQILSSKENMRFHCHVWVPEFEMTPIAPEKCNIIRVPFPTWGDVWGDWVDLWDIASEHESKLSFELFLSIFDKFVLPWFNSIATGNDLVNALDSISRDSEKIIEVIPVIEKKYRRS